MNCRPGSVSQHLADIGAIAYETEAEEGLVVEEGLLVEIVRPGTGDPVALGEVGEVVVTTFNPDYPFLPDRRRGGEPALTARVASCLEDRAAGLRRCALTHPRGVGGAVSEGIAVKSPTGFCGSNSAGVQDVWSREARLR